MVYYCWRKRDCNFQSKILQSDIQSLSTGKAAEKQTIREIYNSPTPARISTNTSTVFIFCADLQSCAVQTKMLQWGTNLRTGNFRRENLLSDVAVFLLGAETQGHTEPSVLPRDKSHPVPIPAFACVCSVLQVLHVSCQIWGAGQHPLLYQPWGFNPG